MLFKRLKKVFAGLIGHFLTVLVYSKKKWRKNSGNIYILCLAFFDSLFLITHMVIFKVLMLLAFSLELIDMFRRSVSECDRLE